jgi:hypothetical protein
MTKRNNAMIPLLTLAGLLLMVPATVSAKDRQFSAIVQRLQSHYQRRPMRFMGLLSFVANRAHPEGLKNLRLAIFEGLDSSRHPADPDLDAFMQEVAGPEFRPFVRVRSRRDGEQTFVYGRELGRDLEVLVVTLESDEACVVKMRVDPERMSEWVDDPPAMSRKAAARHVAARSSNPLQP